MRFSTKNPEEFEQWRYNLLLMAPTKGEAKKTASLGYIRVWWNGWSLSGATSDDILSMTAETHGILIDDPKVLWIKPEILKGLELSPVDGTVFTVEFPEDPAFDPEYDKSFWKEHVLKSIHGRSEPTDVSLAVVSPDRLRKFGLLKPQGKPLNLEFAKWEGRDIIHWSFTLSDCLGIYVPVFVDAE